MNTIVEEAKDGRKKHICPECFFTVATEWSMLDMKHMKNVSVSTGSKGMVVAGNCYYCGQLLTIIKKG